MKFADPFFDSPSDFCTIAYHFRTFPFDLLAIFLPRCAIQTMGDLSVRFGFYGGGYDGDIVGAQDEAGEALTISDTLETW